MKKLIREKTKEEKAAEITDVIMIPSKEFYEGCTARFWFCSECHLVYEPDDVVEVHLKNGIKDSIHCPKCKGNMIFSDEKFLEDNYIFENI